MDKNTPERRRAPRLDCQIPIMLHGQGRSLPALSADLSRVGTLLQLPIDALGATKDMPLGAIAREAMAFLGERVRVDLHHEILGALIQRTARPIRVGRSHPGQEHVEIGLDLLRPLTDMEVEFLGLPLPPLFHEVDITWEPTTTSVSTGGGRDVTVVFCAQEEDSAPPLRIRPGHLDADGARGELGTIEELPVLVDGAGAADVLTRLADVYGGDPNALIFADGQPVWSGPSRLQAVEVCPQQRRIKLQVGFPRKLPPGARGALGL